MSTRQAGNASLMVSANGQRPPVADWQPPAELGVEVDRILARFAPAHLVIDNDQRIVKLHGNAGRYLELAPGRAALDLLGMVREGLLPPLRASLRAARRRGMPVRRQNISVETNGGSESVDIVVSPLVRAGKAWFVVVFEPSDRRPARDAVHDRRSRLPQSASRPGTALDRLRKELAAMREALRVATDQQEITNDELRMANEQFQSANEELQSINEELEISREQLQSSNEQLMTVNEELLNRSIELAALNSDLNNLLVSLHFAIVIVDVDMRIRRFTPAAVETLNLIATDVGRPLGDLNLGISCQNLQGELREVMDTGIGKRLEVQGKGGNLYSLRLRPYMTEANTIGGAAIVTVDVG